MRLAVWILLTSAVSSVACGSSTSSDTPATGGSAGSSGGSAGTGGSGGAGGSSGAAGGQWVWQSDVASSAQLNAVWASAPNDVWAGGDSGAMVHWNGSAWSVVPASTISHVHGIWGASAIDVWAVAGGIGGAGAANLVHWNGTSWSAVAAGTSDNLYAIWGSSPSDVWAVGASGVEGVIVHYAGNTWASVLNSAEYSLQALWGSGKNDVWAAGGRFGPNNGDDHSILHFTGSGSWASVSSGAAGKPLSAVWSAGASEAWAVGQGPMVRWNGTAWSPLADTNLEALSGVWGSDATHVTAVGADAKIFDYDGKAWTSVGSSSGGAVLTAVRGSDTQNRWAVGGNGTIFHFEAGANAEIDCARILGACVGVSSCGSGQGHLSDYACGGGASQVCCVSQKACGGGEPECCSPSGAKSRPFCRDGVFQCTSGTTPCPLPP